MYSHQLVIGQIKAVQGGDGDGDARGGNADVRQESRHPQLPRPRHRGLHQPRWCIAGHLKTDGGVGETGQGSDDAQDDRDQPASEVHLHCLHPLLGYGPRPS